MIEKQMNLSMEDRLDADLAKEVLTCISYWDPNILQTIPTDLYKKLTELAALSIKDFYIDSEKPLIEQDLSEECKDLLGVIYYLYIADSKEKQELLNKWASNQ